MSRTVARRVTFRRRDPEPLVEIVTRLEGDGSGWVNVAPDLGEGGDPRATQPGGWFSARGPAAPHATYVPPRLRRNGRREPAQLGLEHGAGTKAVRQLAAAGHPVPDGWPIRQDHPKRGLVVQVPAGTPAADVVGWLLGAAGLLAQLPLGDAWLAEVWESTPGGSAPGQVRSR